MKKIFPSLFFFLILALPGVFAISTDLNKTYFPRQTLITKISGNFLDPLKSENVFFYSGREKISMEYEIAKIEDSFYLYSILPNKERNYTLIIKNAHYFEAGQDFTQDLEFNFSVQGKVADFTVKPGFVISSKDFFITLESNFDTIPINLTYVNFTSTEEVRGGFSKEVFIPIQAHEKVAFLEIKSQNLTYKVPIKSMAQAVTRRHMAFSKPFSNITLFRGSPYNVQLSLINDGQEEIRNISLSASKTMTLEPKNILSIKPGEYAVVNISLLPEEDETIIISASSETLSANTTIQVNLRKIEVENLTASEIGQYSCSELGGKPCGENQVCSGEEIKTLDTPRCCRGQCKSKSSSFKIFLIILLIIGVAAVGYYILKIRGKKILPESLKQSAISKLTEVRGSLSKT